jgi:16S rRNA C967 or C1407 C5-methylase (RsmB/RsmF family)
VDRAQKTAAPEDLYSNDVTDRSSQRDMARRARLEASLTWLRRYDGLWDDASSFRAALDEPPAVDLFVPGGADARECVREMLHARGIETGTFAWAERHLRVHGWTGAGTLPEVVLGFAFPQGVVSSLPPRLLAPQPGDLILDACAAPGGKALNLHSIAGERSRIVASDVPVARLGMLVQILARHGVPSGLVVRHDGTQFPVVGSFDRILLDAPCSGEGTCRVPRLQYEPQGETGLAWASALQKRLLERALRLLSPGGRLAYATCTYAPEENEAVLTDVLASRPEIQVEELPADMPGQPGVIGWQGESFDPRLVRARRLGPHHTGSWGFFVALLGKDRSATPTSRPKRYGEPLPPRDDADARADVDGWLAERFGVSGEKLDGVFATAHGRDVWVLAKPGADGADVDLSRLNVVAPGLRAVRRSGSGRRATTGVLRWLDRHVTRNVLDLSFDTIAGALASGEPIAVGEPGRGQVAIRCGGRIVGGGWLQDRRVRLEIPKAWR